MLSENAESKADRLLLTAAFGDGKRDVRVTGRSGSNVTPSVAERFERAVFAMLPGAPNEGYLVAVGLARAFDCEDGTADIETVVFARTDPARLDALIRSLAVRYGFVSVSYALGLFTSTPDATNPVVDIRLTDRTVTLDGVRVPITTREFHVLACIAAARRPITTERLTDAVWPDADPWNARATLKVVVHRLRRRIGNVLVCRGGRWELRADATVDLRRAERLLADAFTGTLDEARRAELAILHERLVARLEPSGPSSFETSLECVHAALERRIREYVDTHPQGPSETNPILRLTPGLHSGTLTTGGIFVGGPTPSTGRANTHGHV